jgi:Uncharacterized protein conserved in bacteria
MNEITKNTMESVNNVKLQEEHNFEISKDNKFIARISKDGKLRYIGSKYSVAKDIEKFIESLKDISGNEVIIIFGLAAGEHIKELLNNVGNNNKIIIIEPSKTIVNLFFDMDYAKDIIQDKRVRIYDFYSGNIENIFDKAIEEFEIDNLKIVGFANYEVLFENEFKFLNKALRKIILNKKIGRDTLVFFSKSLFQNFIKNLKNSAGYGVINSYRNLFKGKNAIIVSAGPSLEKNIHLLKDVQKNFVIICGARTLKALTNIGVAPDFVCAVDPQDITYTIMGNELKSEVPLVFMDSANYKLVSEYKGQKILFLNEGMEEYVESILGKKVDSLFQGGSVAHVCAGLAVYLGCNPIVFIGQDLAYTGDKFHAENAKAMENPGDVFVTEMEKNKEAWVNISGENIYVKDINGELVRTSNVLNLYREEFEEIIEKCKEIDFINSTEGGAHIQGTKVMPLKDTIEIYAKEEFNKQIVFRDVIDETTLNNNFITLKDDLTIIRNACQMGIEYSKKMYLYYNKKSDININKVFKELDKVDLIINDMKKIGIVAYLLSPYIEKVLNDEKYVEKINESELESGRRIAQRSKALYEAILNAVEEAITYIN